MIARRLSWYRLATAFAACALLVRMVVPIGFMPMAGAAALIPCPAQLVAPPMAKMPAMHGMDHGAPAHDHQKADQHSCPFAGAAAVADVAAPFIALLPPPVAVAIAVVRPMLARPGLGLAAPPPPKTGPPLLS